MSDPLVEIIRAQQALDRRLGQTEVREVPYGFGVGTAFPASPATNARFFRTDLGWLCYYDGTRWLTMHEYEVPLQVARTVTTAAGTTLIGEVTFRQDYAPYFTRHTTAHSVATTNDGTNNWTFTYRTMNTSGGVDTTLVTWSTSGDGTAVTFHDGTVVTTAAGYGTVQLIVTKNSAPGALTIYGAVLFYRLIIP